MSKEQKKPSDLGRAIDDFIQENWRAIFFIAFLVFCFWAGFRGDPAPHSK